jgi:hypothetical protein
MSLKDWSRNGWLVEHKTSPAEIAELLEIAHRDLTDCRIEGLSADWKLFGRKEISAGMIGLEWCRIRKRRR